jgi:hypothetical protein
MAARSGPVRWVLGCEAPAALGRPGAAGPSGQPQSLIKPSHAQHMLAEVLQFRQTLCPAFAPHGFDHASLARIAMSAGVISRFRAPH